MGTIVNSLIWMIIGIIVDRMVDYMMIPRFNKWREDGNINGHSTRETSERTLKTERERIKHNVN